MKVSGKLISALVALNVLLLATPSVAAPTTSAAKVALHGNEAVAAKHGTLKGHKNPRDAISVTLSLNLQNQAQLGAYLTDLYNPASPNYKQFLTPQQYAAKFGPSVADVQKVTTFANANGLNVTNVAAGNQSVTVSGTVAQMENAFGVTINNYTNTKGQSYYANANAPVVPAEIAGVTNAVVGLDNEAKRGQHATHSNPNLLTPYAGSGPAGGYTPSELRSAYDVTPLTNAGDNGSGQNVALVEFDGYAQTNIATYVNKYSLGSPTPSKVLIDGYSGTAGSGQGEVELDIEVINAIAPKAQVIVYEAPNSDQGELDMYQRIANDNTAKSVSISWGMCETYANTATLNSLHNILAQMAAQGQSVFAAAGDSGAYDCGTSSLAVDSPADDPYVTGVGGTHLNLSSGTYGAESGWSNSSNKSGGGGGLSAIYAQPAWQTGPGVANSYSNGKREVPDVSADADPYTGYSIYSAGSWVVYGGTSCAAPLWAGIAAVNNQYATAVGKASLGQANPVLYKMFNTAQTYRPYHDITSGNNLYYSATSGYDLATGIGSPDAYNLIRDINGAASSTTGTTTTTTTTGTTSTTPTELIKNGGFESGKNYWSETSSGGYEIVAKTRPHSGAYSAFLCGYNDCKDAIAQTVTIPATTTKATLTFWTYVYTTERTHAYDYFYAKLRNTNGAVLSTLYTANDGTASGWVQHSYDVTVYKGQTIQVYFYATNDRSNPTDFFIDDVSLKYQ